MFKRAANATLHGMYLGACITPKAAKKHLLNLDVRSKNGKFVN